MKTLTITAKAALAVVLMVALTACGKKKTSSTVATTAAGICQMNINGTYTWSGNGQPCSPNGGINNGQCTFNGTQWVYPNGTYCPNAGNTNTNSCDYYTQMYSQQYGYPVYYVPVNLGGQYFCVNMNYMNQYNPYYQTGYSDSQWYDYYYDYTPYYGNSCGTQMTFGFSNFNFGMCF